MSQYNSYGVISSLLEGDLILVWQDSSSSNRIISFEDLVASVESLLIRSDNVLIVSGSTSLGASAQFVVGNAGAGITLTLPDASDNPGRVIKIANKGAGDITVQRAGTDAVAADGAIGASATVSQYQFYLFESDGVDTWYRTN